jgi:hypothetical protein
MFSIISSQVSGQTPLTVSGFVYDATTKEFLIGAFVYDLNSKIGVVSNEYGFYNITVESDRAPILQVSYVGYQTQRISVNDSIDSPLSIFLKPGIDLDEITVKANKPNEITRSTETSIVRLQMQEVKMLPNLFGEVDIIKAYQLTPGVQSGGEAKSEMYVRGGSPDQNLIILDDVPLYYVAHFGGFFSIFNADAISDVKLIKGGFPARYGGRLSSVLDVRMKEGNMSKLHGQGSIGLLSFKLLLEGPIVKNKSSFMVSARKNLLPIFRFFGVDMAYGFYDINAKLNFQLSDKDKLFISFYNGDDVVKTKSKSQETKVKAVTKWGNLSGSLRYNRILGKKIFGNFILATTRYRYINSFNNSISSDSTNKSIESELSTGIIDVLMKADLSYQVSSNYLIRFGVLGMYHNITPNDESFSLVDNNSSIHDNFSSKIIAFENSIYTEHEFLNRFFGINAGFRFVSFIIEKQQYYFFEPRLNLNIPLRYDLSIKSSYSISNQFMHLLSYSGTGMPADYWMPSTPNVKPSRAVQYTFGIAKTFSEGDYQFSIDFYYKTMNDLIAFKPGASLIGNLSSWEDVILSEGKGQNYGVELFLQKNQGKSTGWIGLTLSKAEREFADLNEGKPYPFKYDRLLDISIVWNYKINSKMFISTTWNYGSGYPLTVASEHYYIDDDEVFVYDEINSFRMRDYHRLDFGINFPKTTKWGERTWTISIFNLYNRKNPYYYYYDRKLLNILNDGPGQIPVAVYDNLKLYQKSLFSIFPSFSYSFKF